MNLSKSLVFAALAAAAGFAKATTYQLVYLNQPLNYLGSYPVGYSNGRTFAESTLTSFQPLPSLWLSPTASPINLTPPGAAYAQANGLSAVDEVGLAGFGSNADAIVWFDSPNAYVDLAPTQWPGYSYSGANGTNGTQEVGQVTFVVGGNYVFHATCWSGTAASAVDIHPTAQYPNDYSVAEAIASNGMIAGLISGNASDNYFQHACYWANSSATAVDLNPAGWYESTAAATDGIYQIGYGYPTSNGPVHAVIWSGTPGSYVDLGEGQALGGSNGYQVGYVGSYQAVVWQGTGASMQVLPSDGYDAIATTMGTDGTIAGYVFNYGDYYSYPVLWVPMTQDTTPPVITGASVSQNSIWPPNKKMVPVTVNYSATDNVTASSGIVSSLSISCSESVAQSAMVVVDSHHVLLQADRAGNGSGRVYTITISCTDQAGNTATSTVTVTVPHDQGK